MTPYVLLAALPLMAAAPSSLAAMKWERRVLIVNAPDARHPSLAAQRRILSAWKAGGDARDLSVVEIVGTKVDGATDAAATLRRRYRLPATGFTAILIGKDGGEKLRADKPFPAAALEEVIDAMPMRRAGQR